MPPRYLLRPPLRTLRAYSTIQRLSLSTRRGNRHITASTRSALLPRQLSTLRTCRSCQAGVTGSKQSSLDPSSLLQLPGLRT